jgi:hypothetical protein
MKQEIKDKLIEIGYTGKTDLETLLDALPQEREGFGGDAYFKMNKNGLWYERSWNCPLEINYYIEKLENESLADTAGRMIILLHEKNLIKFNNDNIQNHNKT